MRISIAALLLTAASSNAAFVPNTFSASKTSPIIVKGYLDDLSGDLYSKDEEVDVVADSREANKMDKSQVDRYGPGALDQFVDFDEFDGGDGQMGVAGDGTQGLDKSDFNTGELAKNMDKSKMRSARNAWGTSTGYADSLVKDKGMDVARAQQLENWANQQEIQAQKKQQRYQTEQFDNVQQNAEADWRTLAKFGVERNTDVDLNETFGAQASVADGEIEGTIEIKAPTGTLGYHEFNLRNPYMGFADFRAAFTPETSAGWSVTPNEGSLMQREDTMFAVRYKPDHLGISEGYLVIETEDFKKVWKVVGST